MSTTLDESIGFNAEMRKLSIETRKAEIDFKRSESDRELRRWCIEQIDTVAGAEHAISQAEKVYDWVRNQPKADAA